MEVCGSVPQIARYSHTLPIPEGGERFHAIDDAGTVLFIWRPKSRSKKYSEYLVNIARIRPLEPEEITGDYIDTVEVLAAERNAIAYPEWIATIIDEMGFGLIGCRFKVTAADDVPAFEWKFLNDAVNRKIGGDRD
jgi:hypothetical protein